MSATSFRSLVSWKTPGPPVEASTGPTASLSGLPGLREALGIDMAENETDSLLGEDLLPEDVKVSPASVEPAATGDLPGSKSQGETATMTWSEVSATYFAEENWTPQWTPGEKNESLVQAGGHFDVGGDSAAVFGVLGVLGGGLVLAVETKSIPTLLEKATVKNKVRGLIGASE
jgi:hypothetical protein